MPSSTTFCIAFMESVNRYAAEKALGPQLWTEIEHAYQGKKRFYHNLQHLDHLFSQLLQVKDKIRQWDLVIFAIAYHDIIYNISRPDNEEKSAGLAAKRLAVFLDKPSVEQCTALITATKGHTVSADSDINYFTDADLSVLGAASQEYEKYRKEIRKEYSVYPEFIYNAGRKKVLIHFLQMKNVYKTAWFYQQYEEPARVNLQRELSLL